MIVTADSEVRWDFIQKLFGAGYTLSPLPTYYNSHSARSYFNDKGILCVMNITNDSSKIELSVKRLFSFDAGALGTEWPSPNTNLGLDVITFDRLPKEFLPKDFPTPPDDAKITSVKQKENGLFIKFSTISEIYNIIIIFYLAFMCACGYTFNHNTNG